MLINRRIIGDFVDIRDICTDDAKKTLLMRLDEKKNKYLHKVENDINKQLLFIKQQIESKDSILLIVENKKNEIVGMRGIYKIKDDSAEVGRTLFIGSPVETIEAYCMIYDYIFEIMRLEIVTMEALEPNINSRGMQKKFGAVEYKKEFSKDFDCEIVYSYVSKNNYYKNRKIIEYKLKKYYFGHNKLSVPASVTPTVQ